MYNAGDIQYGRIARVPFNSATALGGSVNPSTNGTIKVYKDFGTTAITGASITYTASHNSEVGTHVAFIDTSADPGFVPGAEYGVKLVASAIDGQDPVNAWIGAFSIQDRYTPGLIYRGNAQLSPDLDTIKLPSAAAFPDNYLKGSTVSAVAGPGWGTSRYADSNTLSGDLVAVSPALPVLFTTSTYIEVFGTPPASTAAASRPEVDVKSWNGTPVPAEHTAGYPIVTNKVGTGTGEEALSGGCICAKDYAGADLATASVLSSVSTAVGTINTNAAAIKLKTDGLTFDIAGYASVNIKYINNSPTGGDGSTGSKWRKV